MRPFCSNVYAGVSVPIIIVIDPVGRANVISTSNKNLSKKSNIFAKHAHDGFTISVII